MGSHSRKEALRCSAVVLAVAVVVPVASGIAAATRTSAVPAKQVGKWTRKVTSADVKRTGATGTPDGSVWTLTIKKSGAAVVSSPGVDSLDGNIVPAGVDRVHININLVTPTPNIYRWSVSGRLLTFTKISDPIPDRAAIFAGVWKRK